MVAVVYGSLETLGRKLLGFRHRPNATVSQWPLEWLRRVAPHAVALTPKGAPIRCTVLGSRPKRAAILRTLSPVAFLAFKASRIRFSSSAGIRGRPRRLPSSLALLSPARTRS